MRNRGMGTRVQASSSDVAMGHWEYWGDVAAVADGRRGGEAAVGSAGGTVRMEMDINWEKMNLEPCFHLTVNKDGVGWQ